MRHFVVVIALVGALVLLEVWSVAANVSFPLDPSFGTQGGYTVTTITTGLTEDEPFELVRQADGKFVAPGKSWGGPSRNTDFTVMRWNADGSQDSSFGTGGWSQIDFFGGVDEALGVALQPDGKIVVVGTVFNTGNGSTDMGIARLNPDGSLDTTFATDGVPGMASVDFTGGADMALGVVLLDDGKIMVGGYATIFGRPSDFALSRFNSDGSLDTSFGLGGRVATDIAGQQDIIMRLRLQADGKIVAGGTSFSASTHGYDFALARYLPTGQLDPTFSPAGKPGVETVDFTGGSDIGFATILRYDGKIIMGGISQSAQTGMDIGLAQFNADGTLDTNFAVYGKPGVVTTDYSGLYDQALALAIQPDGKILVAGHTVSPTTGFDFALTRYLPNGELDSSFGSGGKVSTNFWGGPDGSHGIALLPEGKAVLVGDAENPATGGDDVILARYLVVDPNWIQGYIFTTPIGYFSDAAERITMLIDLNSINNDIKANDYGAALTKLASLRTHLDGCGVAPDVADWIINCDTQLVVREQVDQLIGKLGGP
jgi:uncharacterized delta-60 repeat protein